MVTIINNGISLRSTFYYNENKVKDGVAACIMAQNYPVDLEGLTEKMRLNMLLKRIELNAGVKRPSIHISLNFAPEESHSKETLTALADEYMERIGFGRQPFLVYRHRDAGHDHIHIVTTKIRPDGSCINTHNIGRNQSETARKEMEIKYGLVRAEDQKASAKRMQPVEASRALYGKQVTKRAISNVLNEVISSFKYASLEELNAVLNLYNVVAERGSEASRTYKAGGLVYRVLNKDGERISAPIKASAFFQKPTLKDLEGRFLKNDLERQQYKSRLKSSIDFILMSKSADSIEAFSGHLSKQQIRVVERRSKEGLLYGLTYVDLKNKVVFNGSAIGKDYSAKAVMERIGLVKNAQVQPLNKEHPETKNQNSETRPAIKSVNSNQDFQPGNKAGDAEKGLLEQLMQSENVHEYLPYELRRTRKKRKKRNNRL